MNLITCCNPVKGSDFLQDLKFVALLSAFFKRVYPDGQIFCATCGDLPDFFLPIISPIRFPFNTEPFARARANFLHQYVSSSLFNEPTLFTGRDVVLLNSIDDGLEHTPVVTNYRFHLSMPYCADFIYANPCFAPSAKAQIVELFKSFYLTHCYMPQEIQDFWADQLSWSVVMGMPEINRFNGLPFITPRIPFVTALPADPWFLTPEDFFPTKAVDARPGYSGDLLFVESNYPVFMKTKKMLHFKGKRKGMMFEFSRWAIDSNIISPVDLFPGAPPGYFDIIF